MKLTPLRTRGKRRRNQDLEDSASNVSDPPPRKKLKNRMKAKKVTQGSQLDRLPGEILERILVFSENPAFARTTSTMGVKLSGKKTLMDFIIAAFGPTWDSWFGQEIGQVASYHGFDSDPAHISGSPIFQSAVLACPWVTLSLILDAQQLWLSRTTRQLSGKLGALSVGEQVFVEEYANLSVTEAFAKRLGSFRENPDRNCIMSLMMGRMRDLGHYIYVHPETLIPNPLLSASFTNDSADLLLWLVSGNATLQPSQTWELTLEGFKNLWALTADPKLRFLILDLYLRLDVFAQWPFSVRQEMQMMVLKSPLTPLPGMDASVCKTISRNLMFPEFPISSIIPSTVSPDLSNHAPT